jgi:dihydrodipicolinate synthase/N-acetylneuraminate lyase
MKTVTAIYHQGRPLNSWMPALKAALHCRGLCGPHVLPPLLSATPAEMEAIRGELARFGLLA